MATGSETPTLADDDLPPAAGSTDPGPFAPSATLATGAQVGRYLVLAKIDEGGMGVVYAAYDQRLESYRSPQGAEFLVEGLRKHDWRDLL